MEYRNTFEGAIEELEKAAKNAIAPLVEALEELAKTMNEQLPSSDEAAAALANLYGSLEGNHKMEQYSYINGKHIARGCSHAKGQQSLAKGSWQQALDSLKNLGKEKETYVTSFKPGHEPIEITFKEKEKDLLEETSLNDWYDNFLENL